MFADGFLFLSINNGPVTSVPVAISGDRFEIDLWYGGVDASESPHRAHITGLLTPVTDDPESTAATPPHSPDYPG